MIVGTGGTTGRPKGVMLTGTNLETMTAITLMSYPFEGRPVYLALAPLTHAAGVLCFPVLTLGGEIVVMRSPDVGGFLELVERHHVTHTFLPPTLIYMVLAHEALDTADLSSLQCFWYGAAPMSATRLEEALVRIGPVMGQLFGQTEAPMMISTLAPRDHFRADGSIAHERLSSAGRPAPLVTVSIMAEDGALLPPRASAGEIVVRSSLVMAGYHRNPEATAEASAYGWHHTGDIGYLDDDGFLHIVDRAKDMVITGGFNVYSTEVEQALMAASGRPGLRCDRAAGREVGRAGHRRAAAAAGRQRRAGRDRGVRQGAHRQRQGAQAGGGLARPAALEGREGAQVRHPGVAAVEPPLTDSRSRDEARSCVVPGLAGQVVAAVTTWPRGAPRSAATAARADAATPARGAPTLLLGPGGPAVASGIAVP